jgi:hypothetical protein
MNRTQAKKYILDRWKVSDGKKISAMVERYSKRYWKKKDIIVEAKKIFDVK